MKLVKSIVRYYIVFCICQLLVILCDQKFVINQFSILGIVFVPFIIGPLHTIIIAGVHYFKINRKILGNIILEIISSFLPSIIIGAYSFVVSHLTENRFVLSENGNCLYRKWYLDDTNIGIIAYIVFLFILFFHGRGKKDQKSRIGEGSEGQRIGGTGF